MYYYLDYFSLPSVSLGRSGILPIFAVESTVITAVPGTEQTISYLLKELICMVYKIYMLFILLKILYCFLYKLVPKN